MIFSERGWRKEIVKLRFAGCRKLSPEGENEKHWETPTELRLWRGTLKVIEIFLFFQIKSVSRCKFEFAKSGLIPDYETLRRAKGFLSSKIIIARESNLPSKNVCVKTLGEILWESGTFTEILAKRQARVFLLVSRFWLPTFPIPASNERERSNAFSTMRMHSWQFVLL